MFNNNKTFFNSRLETDEAADILKRFQKAVLENDSMSAEKNLDLIKENTKLRLEENYIEPAKNKLMPAPNESCAVNTSFLLMTVNCILIELYYEIINGLDLSNQAGGKVKNAYIDVLQLMDSDITDELATIFYKGIRCGIMHQGQTTASTALVLDRDLCEDYFPIMEKNGEFYISDVQEVFRRIEKLYEKYWKEIADKSYDSQEVKNLIKKYEYIIKNNKDYDD